MSCCVLFHPVWLWSLGGPRGMGSASEEDGGGEKGGEKLGKTKFAIYF